MPILDINSETDALNEQQRRRAQKLQMDKVKAEARALVQTELAGLRAMVDALMGRVAALEAKLDPPAEPNDAPAKRSR